MIEENQFDYENYIQIRLKEIDDLDERRFAKELLLEGLAKVFACTEKKYESLKQRIAKELTMPGERFHTFMTIIERGNYDPINDFWFPVCGEDLKKSVQKYETIYLMADEKRCQEFLMQGVIEGIDQENGQVISFKIRQSQRYLLAVKELYRLFVENHVPWQVIHMGHLDRFFDLVPVGEDGEGSCHDSQITYQWEKWQEYVKTDMIPLWNIQRMEVHSQEFQLPCIDDVFYEHIFYLPEGQAEEDGYLVKMNEEILSVRYERNKILLKLKKEVLNDVVIYRMHQKRTDEVYGYNYKILSNQGKDSFAVRYLQKTGNFLQTPVELYRKVEKLSGEYRIELAGYVIQSQLENAEIGKEEIYGDMNPFARTQVFSHDKRSVLLFKILKNEEHMMDYLYGSQIRYILSQMQMEFPEYQCIGLCREREEK